MSTNVVDALARVPMLQSLDRKHLERLAKDFSNDIGISHSYLFAEYTYANVNNFGRKGLDLSSRHWMFGFSVDY